jgi:AcrR family transcriptional regulator
VTASPAFQRARRPEQKEQRRAAILDAARQLASERGVGEVTLTEVAARVGLAHSNVLRYFETREEVYLHLLAAEWDAWKAAVEERLRSSPATPAGVAAALVETAVERPLFCDLHSQAASVLERNVSGESARQFKLAALGAVGDLAAAVADALPELGREGPRTVVTGCAALIAGLWPIANPSERVAGILEDPELRHGRVEFGPRLRSTLEPLIVGLVEQRSRRPRSKRR